jgi:hypothetical protein
MKQGGGGDRVRRSWGNALVLRLWVICCNFISQPFCTQKKYTSGGEKMEPCHGALLPTPPPTFFILQCGKLSLLGYTTEKPATFSKWRRHCTRGRSCLHLYVPTSVSPPHLDLPSHLHLPQHLHLSPNHHHLPPHLPSIPHHLPSHVPHHLQPLKPIYKIFHENRETFLPT